MAEGASTDAAAPVAAATSTSAAQLPGDILADVEREHALADLQAALKASEERIDKLVTENKTLETERDGAVSSTSQLRSQLASLQSAHLQSSSEMSVIQSRIDASEREKRELLEEIQRLQERSQRTNHELYTLRTQKSEASQKIAQLDVEVSELKMSTNSAKFNEQRAIQSLSNARNEILNLNKASTEIESRFNMYRAQTQSELSDLQNENQTLQDDVSTYQSRLESLQRSFAEHTRRLGEAQTTIANLKTSAASQHTSFRLELERLEEENRILVKRNEDRDGAIADREAELEHQATIFSQKEAAWQEKIQRAEEARKVAEKRADDFKITVERLAIAGGDSRHDLSPAATLAARQRESGKSYTQFFTDYTIMETKLHEVETENVRLTDLLTEISQDLAEKKPLLEEQAAEHDAAIERANALAAELASAHASRDNFESRAKALEATKSHDEEELKALRTTTEDLSRQVQGLLREIAIRDDPSLAHVGLDENAKISEGDLITDRLLEFKSLRALQQQNQKLLKLTRGLVAKLEARDVRRATADASDMDTAASLDEAAETIEKLHSKLLESEKKINELTRERDFFSKLLSRGEGLRWANGASASNPLAPETENEAALSSLQAELDIVRTKADAEIAEAKKEARQKAEAAGTAEVDKVRAEAKAQILEEQQRILSETHQLQQQANASLEAQVRQLQGQISQTQLERRNALEQVAQHQASESRLRDEAALLRAEKEQWESVQSRLQSDFSSVQQERVRLQHLIDNLNNVSSENEKTKNEHRTMLERRIEELQREAGTLRSQVDQAREATRVAEQKASEADARIASETASIRSEKEAAEAQVTAKATEIETLQSQLDDAKRIGLNWQRRSRELQTKLVEASNSTSGAVAEKEKEIENLKSELETAKSKITELEGKIAEAERSSTLKDETITRLQGELETAKASQSNDAAASSADSEKLTALQSERDELQQKLSQAEKDLEAAKAAQPAEGAADNSESTTKLAETEKELAELNQKYERDVRKVNRANVNLLKGKDSADAKVAELQEELDEAKKKLEEATAAASSGGDGGAPDQATIDAAVNAALKKREGELKAEHEAELEKVKSEAASNTTADPEAVKKAVEAKETELKAQFAKELEEAKKKATDEATAAGSGDAAATAKVTELEAKVKDLSRQLRTAEISRKTLERTKATLEAKVKSLGGEGSSTPTASPATPTGTTPTTGLSASASAFKPAAAKPAAPAAKATPAAATPAKTDAAATTETPAAEATPAAATPATTTAPARGTSVRGRARGTAIRGRGAAPGRTTSVLNAVNATLATNTNEGGTKRPAPEDESAAGTDILARLQTGNGTAAPATTGTQTRAAKRARGGAAARGRGTGRRASGGAGGAGAGAGEGTGGGEGA